MNNAFARIWKMPIVLATLTAFGLLAALLGTGLWHWLSWLALTTPIAVGLRHSLFCTTAKDCRFLKKDGRFLRGLKEGS